MVEIREYVPEEIAKETQQVGNFFQAWKEVRNSPHRGEMARLQRATLMGYGTLVPDMVAESGALTSEPRANVIRAMLKYQVALNDRLDFEGANRSDLTDAIDEIRTREGEHERILETTIPLLPHDEQERAWAIISTAVTEIETIEHWIREHRDRGTITPGHIDIYRNLINAISTTEFSAITFGPGHFDNRLLVQSDPTNPEDIQDKYAWVLSDSAETDEERALMIMHNITMVAQVMDDTVGQKIDSYLDIPSYAAAAYKMADGDPKLSKAILTGYKQKYKDKVKDLGLGFIGRRGAFNISRAIFDAGAVLVEQGKKSDRIRTKLIKRLPIRERLYLEGTLVTDISKTSEEDFAGEFIENSSK